MTAYQAQIDPTAVMGRRIVAFVIDLVIVSGLWIGVAAATTSYDTISDEAALRAFGREDMCEGVNGSSSDANFDVCTLTITMPNGNVLTDRLVVFTGSENYVIESGSSAVSWLVGLGYWLLVFVIWQGLSGMTPGKALLGVRAVNEAGEAPGIARAFIRSLLMIVDGLCCYLVGLIAAITSKGHRRVGDMAAKTYVVGKSSMGAGPIAIPGATPAPAPAYAATDATWGVTPPMMPPTGAPESPPEAPAAPPAAGEPQWDAARNAYIQWDAAQQKWLQFDDATQQWRAID